MKRRPSASCARWPRPWLRPTNEGSCTGISHAHGIIHRDLKPENIFLLNHPDYPDYVKVLDFGIAKLIGDQASPESHLTEGGTVVGTPAYMSPEQCRARGELDHRSDIYSLGVMLYQMLVGQVPFRALSITDVLIAHVQEKPVPPIEINPKLSIHLNAAILRALEKDPGRRFSSMRELRDAIERAPNAIPPGLTEETFAKREQREASFVVDKLTQIILQRLERDSLLIPSMPAIAIQCIGLLDDPNQTFSDVGKLVGRDPVLASRVLRMANSAAFPGKVAVATLEQAIVRMGTEGLKLALVNYSMYQAFSSKNERIRSSFRGIWEHSLAVARRLSDSKDPPTGSCTTWASRWSGPCYSKPKDSFRTNNPSFPGSATACGPGWSTVRTDGLAPPWRENGICQRRSAARSRERRLTIPLFPCRSPTWCAWPTRSPNKRDSMRETSTSRKSTI